uniref:Lung adenoma susceptibility protein 2-like n=1 Tax=Sinocyclocheilus rhinocerous TaxID=307959 RepID=A0A673MR60_9TELE
SINYNTVLVDGLMSPESSVTSLLATSGLLQSSLHPEPVPSIKYRDKHYASASEALDAYITDFQRTNRTHPPDTPRSNHLPRWMTNDKIGSLILRAEQALHWSSVALCEPVKEHNSSGDTEDALDADRSWDNPPVTL